MPASQRTPLTAWHEAHGGKMVDFAGYWMPVQYESVLAEHRAVREACGIFDISHMGEIAVRGSGARAGLDGLVTNNVAALAVGRVLYTALCNERGTVLDDLLVYCLGEEHFLVVANASNRAKVVAWMHERLATVPHAQVSDESDATALIAVQGPRALEVMTAWPRLAAHQSALGALSYYHAIPLELDGASCALSRTGYTGERGYELYVPARLATPCWTELLAAGAPLGLRPVGLAARDTLRLEAGYCLYGHELDEETTPLQAGIGWVVKLDGREFVGSAALRDQKRRGVLERSVGLLLPERAIAREGAAVHAGAAVIGRVTSGTFSPTLGRGIALARLQHEPSGGLEVEVRGKRHPVTVTRVPFVPTRVKD